MKAILGALLIMAAVSTSSLARDCKPPLPYSCATVRWAVATFPQSYLEAQGKKQGVTACQRAAAKACMKEGGK